MNDLPAVISELAHKAADLAKPADDDQAGEAKPGHKPVAPKPGHQPAAPKTTDPAVPVALDLGWTMALLFRLAGRSQTAAARSDRLPTEHELPAGQRSELELGRVNSLIVRLGALLPWPAGQAPEPSPASLGRQTPAMRAADVSPQPALPDDTAQTLTDGNLRILKWLACAGREYSLAYQLGRSLRDTADPPIRPGDPDDAGDPAKETPSVEAVTHQLSRSRVTKLQEWLATLGPRLPDDAAAIVSASMGRWCDLVTMIYDDNAPGSLRGDGTVGSTLTGSLRTYPTKSQVADELLAGLLPQGDTWLNLLVGAESTDGLLTPEAYLAAGEAALSRTGRIIRKIIRHYWIALVVLALLVGVVVYFAASDLTGAGKLWTQIAAVAGALGVTAKGIGSAMASLSRSAEKPIFGAEKIDAMAWATTSIPANLKLTGTGVRALRRSGIRPSNPLGRA